jgi:hypothetical protein
MSSKRIYILSDDRLKYLRIAISEDMAEAATAFQ